jgi:asparagine synthase (glutamine-hydrolysing)
MCGIVGQFNFTTEAPVDLRTVQAMSRSVAHRGPDDEGHFVSGPLGLGFRRLSIIDLAGGHQPMSDVEESVRLVFNGEIYNFPELREELQRVGHAFRTRSDTEVIIEGYKAWDLEVFDRLNGMFGLALWDARRRRLVVARDAMGIKLVYYRNANGRLTFGSEIRAVLAAEAGRPNVDPAALSQFLRYRYTPSPLTIFSGIRKLAPGTMLVVENGECHERRWYDYAPTPFEESTSENELTEELLRLYRAAIKRHLLSDVPLGILLSGGLDSGLLLALMAEHGQEWPAYTVGYGASFEDDELADAAESASLLGGRHVPVQIDQQEFERSLPQIVDCVEEPIASSSIVPMYFVCKRAREDVKVAFIGQGPDELFGGYKRHLGVHYGHAWRTLPQPVRRAVRSVVDWLPRNETAKRGVYALGMEDRLARYEHTFSLAPAERITALFRQELRPHTIEPVAAWPVLLSQAERLGDLAAFQHLEIRSSLPDELLMFADKMSMAHRLEARVPYLDRTVVEFAERLSSSMKIKGMKGKHLHRRVCESFLPAPILRRKKRGFAVNVVDRWFRSPVENSLSDFLLDDASLIFGLLEPAPVRALLDEHRSGRHDNHKVLFSLAMFEAWLRGSSAFARR